MYLDVCYPQLFANCVQPVDSPREMAVYNMLKALQGRDIFVKG